MESELGVNTYDCRECRSSEWNKSRVCLLYDRPRGAVVGRDGAWYFADGELVAALVNDTPTILNEVSALHDPDGRELCFVAAISREAAEVMAIETDSKEYGFGKPRNRAMIVAMRVARAEKAAVQREREQMKRREK